MASSNLDRLKAAYQEWDDTKGGSVDTWLALCAPNITFLSSGMGRAGVEFSAACTSLDDVRRYFAQLSGTWEMQHFTVDQYLVDGETICATGSTAWTHKTTGKTADVLKADLWTFEAGKAIRIIEHYDSAALIEAATPG